MSSSQPLSLVEAIGAASDMSRPRAARTRGPTGRRGSRRPYQPTPTGADRPRSHRLPKIVWFETEFSVFQSTQESMSTWPAKLSFAAWPSPLRANSASGSVVDTWVGLELRSPRKSFHGFRPPALGKRVPLLVPRPDAHAGDPRLQQVPSRLKCSSDSRRCRLTSFTTAPKNWQAGTGGHHGARMGPGAGNAPAMEWTRRRLGAAPPEFRLYH